MKIISGFTIILIVMLLSGFSDTATCRAGSADEIDAKVNAVLPKFYQEVGAAMELSKKSKRHVDLSGGC